MKILITGSNGLLGQKLVALLQKTPNVEFMATAVGANRLRTAEPFLYQSLDITNAQAVAETVEKYRPTCIINAAAMTQVDDCETQKDACWLLNTTAVAHLIQACARHQVHLVQLSTDFIFDGEKGTLYTETDAANPLSFYGKSKLAAENLLLSSSVSHAILRTALVYGVAQDLSRANIVTWLKKQLELGAPIKVVNDQLRTPTLAEDLAQACLLVAQYKALGIYNISGEEPLFIHEIAQKIAQFWHLSHENITLISSQTLNQAAKRPPKTGFDIQKAKKDIKYNPHSLEQGLALIQKQLVAAEKKG